MTVISLCVAFHELSFAIRRQVTLRFWFPWIVETIKILNNNNCVNCFWMLCKMVIINIIASNYDLEMILMTSPLSVLLPDISSLFSQQLISILEAAAAATTTNGVSWAHQMRWGHDMSINNATILSSIGICRWQSHSLPSSPNEEAAMQLCHVDANDSRVTWHLYFDLNDPKV